MNRILESWSPATTFGTLLSMSKPWTKLKVRSLDVLALQNGNCIKIYILHTGKQQLYVHQVCFKTYDLTLHPIFMGGESPI